MVSTRLQTQRLVSGMSGLVLGLDVKSKADHVGLGAAQAVNVLEQRSKHPLLAIVPDHVDALKPPDPPITPVTPLAGDGGLSDRTIAILGDPVAESAGIRQRLGNTPTQDGSFEDLRLRLPRSDQDDAMTTSTPTPTPGDS